MIIRGDAFIKQRVNSARLLGRRIVCSCGSVRVTEAEWSYEALGGPGRDKRNLRPSTMILAAQLPDCCARASSEAHAPASVNHRLLGSRAGQRPYGQLVVALSRVGLLADEGPDDAAQESERDRDQPGVAQWEPVEVRHSGTATSGVPETTGEKVTSSTAMISPP